MKTNIAILAAALCAWLPLSASAELKFGFDFSGNGALGVQTAQFKENLAQDDRTFSDDNTGAVVILAAAATMAAPPKNRSFNSGREAAEKDDPVVQDPKGYRCKRSQLVEGFCKKKGGGSEWGALEAGDKGVQLAAWTGIPDTKPADTGLPIVKPGFIPGGSPR